MHGTTNKDRGDQKAVNAGDGRDEHGRSLSIFYEARCVGREGWAKLFWGASGGRKDNYQAYIQGGLEVFFLYLCTNTGWNRAQIIGQGHSWGVRPPWLHKMVFVKEV